MAAVSRKAWKSSEDYLVDGHIVIFKYNCIRLADAMTEFLPVLYSTHCRTQPTTWGIQLSYFKSPDEYDDTFNFSICLKRVDQTSNRAKALFIVSFFDEDNSPIFRQIKGNKEWMASNEETEDSLKNILPIKLNEIEGVWVTLVIGECHSKCEGESASKYGINQTLRGESAIAFKYCTDRESARGSKDCTGGYSGYSATGSKDCSSGKSASGSKDGIDGEFAGGSKDGTDGELAGRSKDGSDGEFAGGSKDGTDGESASLYKDCTGGNSASASKAATGGNSEHLGKVGK